MSLVKIEPFITDNVANFTFGGLTITANANVGNANLGNLASANFATISSNLTTGNANLGNAATANFFIGNGSYLTGISATTAVSLINGNSNIIVNANGNASISISGTNNVVVYTSSGETVTGTVTATHFSGEAGNLSNITGANVIGVVANANYSAYAGVVTANAQPNITSLGLLANLSVMGNSSVIGNANVIGNINLNGTGNAILGNLVTANYFTGTLTTAAQPNITSTGTLTSLTVNGNTVITGNLTVTGNTTYVNSNVTELQDPIIQLGTGANGATLSSNLGVDIGTVYNYYNTAAQTAFIGWKTANADFEFVSNATVNSNNVITVNNLGNIRAGNANLGNSVTSNYFIGSGNNLSNIQGGNVTGQVGNALLAGTVYTNAQPNITSVGTLSSLAITGNISSGNANLGNLIVGNYITGTLTTNSQPNITSVGTLTALSVTANITAGNISGANTITSNYFTGVLTTSGQPNVTSVGTLTSLAVTGNITAGNVSGGNLVSANYISGNGSLLTSLNGANVTGTTANANYAAYAGNIIVNAQPNITSVGTLTSLAVTANVTAGNANLGNLVTANFFSGSGNGLTSVAAVTAGTVTASNQPNIQTVGTLVNVTIGNSTSNTIINASGITSNVNVSLSGANITLGNVGNIKISGGTSGYFLTTDGNSNLSWAATSGGGGTSASGANTQIQYNSGGTTLGASANLTFNYATNTLSTTNLVTTGTANLGNVANVKVTGGSNNQILSTDGTGNLSWIAQPASIIYSDTFTGDGTTVSFSLAHTPTSINQTLINYNGVLQLRSAYTLSGNTITFSSAPASGALIEISTTLDLNQSAGVFVNRSYTGNNVQTTFAVSTTATATSVIVTENGIIQTPGTDYTVSAGVLTFATAPTTAMAIQIRELGVMAATTNFTAGSWTTLTRPSPPANGMIGYNLTNSKLEAYANGAWGNITLS